MNFTGNQNRPLENELVDDVTESDFDINLRNVSSNELFIKDSGELWPINDKPTNSNMLCNDSSCYSENTTCVGEPEYCNFTEEEYLQMVYDYIFPTPGEWVLIGFHTVVFLIGLVSKLCT